MTGRPTDASDGGVPVGRRVVETPDAAGQLGGEDQPDADRLAVAPAVALAALDGVAEGVAVVEDLAQVGLAQVGGHDVALDPDRADDELRRARRRSGRAPPRGRPRRGRGSRGSAMNPVLITSAMPAASSARLTVARVSRSAITAVGSWKAPTRFLPAAGVDAGLAADGGVDHREQGGRHVDDPHAAHPGGRDEAGEVGRRAAADRHDGVGAGHPEPAELLPAGAGGGEVLAVLAVGQVDAGGRRVPAASRSSRDGAVRTPATAGWWQTTTRRGAGEGLGDRAGDPAADDHVVRARRPRRGGARGPAPARHRRPPPRAAPQDGVDDVVGAHVVGARPRGGPPSGRPAVAPAAARRTSRAG